MANTYALGRKSRIFIVPEVTAGTAVAHAGTDILSHKAASLTYSEPESEVDERKGTAGVLRFIRDAAHTVSWSVSDAYFKPAAAAATAPESSDILKAAFGSQYAGHSSSVTVQASASPTVSSCTLNSVAALSEGSAIRFSGNVTSALAGEIVWITDITGSAITWVPALSTAPQTNDTATIGYAWGLTDENAETLSIYGERQHHVVGASGCMCNEISFTASRNGALNFSASGSGYGYFSAIGQSAITDNPLTSTATTVNVTAGDGDKFFLDSSVPLYAQIGSEVVKITAATADALTIVRAQKSSSAAPHSAGVEILPWSPTLSRVGSEISGIVGKFRIDGATFAIHDVSLTLNNAFELRENSFGSYVSSGHFRSGNNPRKVTGTVTCKMRSDVLKKFKQAIDQDTHTIYCKIGSAAYTAFAFYMPKARFVIPELPEGDTSEIVVSLQYTAIETSGNDELYFAMA